MFTFNFTGNITRAPQTQIFEDRMMIRIPVASNAKVWSPSENRYVEKATFADLTYNVAAGSKLIDQLRVGREVIATGRIQTETRTLQDGSRKVYVNYVISDLELGHDPSRARSDADSMTVQQSDPSIGNDSCPF